MRDIYFFSTAHTHTYFCIFESFISKNYVKATILRRLLVETNSDMHRSVIRFMNILPSSTYRVSNVVAVEHGKGSQILQKCMCCLRGAWRDDDDDDGASIHHHTPEFSMEI